MDSWQQKFEIKQQKLEMEQQNILIKQQPFEIKQQKLEMEQQNILIKQQQFEIRQQKLEMEQQQFEIKQKNILIKQQKIEQEQKQMRLEFQKGFWYKGGRWTTAHAKITYDKLLLSSTNMENPGIGLNTQSGIIAFLNHCIPSCNNSPRSVHSACDRGVASLIQPAVSSEHCAGEHCLHLPQPAEDRGDSA